MKIEPFRLERYLAAYEFQAPYLLCTSDCETITAGEILDMNNDPDVDLRTLRLGYTESRGNPLLRQEIAGLYAIANPDDVVVFSGAEEGIFVFMNALLEQGDHVIVQYPAYQSLYQVAKAIGCAVSFWIMDEERGWQLDMDLLNESIGENTRAIIINSPHNPTGQQLSRGDLEKIIEIAREHDLYLFSDEVYRYLEYDEGSCLPPVADLYEKGISLGVMSKAFGLAGLRIGWITTKNQEILRKISVFKDYTTICNSAPSECFSIIALRNKDTLISRNLGIIRNNLESLDDFFTRHSDTFSWTRPVAGTTGFPRILTQLGSEQFCADLITYKGVLLLPGTQFDFDDQHFRIGFGRSDMEESLKKLDEFLIEG